MKYLLSILCVLLLLSCEATTSPTDQDVEPGAAQTDIPQFSDLLPADLPDSSKSTIINDLTAQTESDTSLAEKISHDKTGVEIIAWYRNDSLVKLATGTGITKGGFAVLQQQSYSVYYFYRDELISYRSVCSNIQHTGMCNPVSAVSLFYFYDGKIINEEHDIHIGSYGLCGCSDLSYYKTEGLTGELEKEVMDELERLRELLRHDQ